MSYYLIRVSEQLTQDVCVRADDGRDAIAKVEDAYYNVRNLELTADNHSATSFKVLGEYADFSGTDRKYTEHVWEADVNKQSEEKIPEHILELLRLILTDSPTDTTMDDEIRAYSKREIFEKVLEFEGIIGYSSKILSIASALWNMELN